MVGLTNFRRFVLLGTVVIGIAVYVVIGIAFSVIGIAVSDKHDLLPRDLNSIFQHSAGDKEQHHPTYSALVHIGPHKTSSTYIQSQICQNIAELKALKLDVPLCDHSTHCANKHFSELAQQLDQGANVKGVHDAAKCFLDALPHNASVIMSSESLCKMRVEAIHRLASMLHRYRVQVAYFYRSKARHLQSYYFQMQRRAQLPMLASEFMRNSTLENARLEQPCSIGQSCSVSAQTALQRWSGIFGEKNVHVLHYDAVLALGQDTFETLISTLTGFSIRARNSVWVNTSPPHTDVARYVFVVRYIAENWHRNVTVECAHSADTAIELADILTLNCTDYFNDTGPFEQAEMQYIRSSNMNLHYFDAHRGEADSIMCDVPEPWNAPNDDGAVERLHAVCAEIMRVCSGREGRQGGGAEEQEGRGGG